MLFDSTILCRIAADLERTTVGSRIQRAFAIGKTTLVLELGRRMTRPQIVLSCDPQFGRVHMDSDLSPTPGDQSPLADVCRRYLRGAVITAVTQPRFDRILRIGFVNAQGLGREATCTLVAEIMGKRGNLILLDADDDVLECARHVTADINRYRQLVPGIPYVPPPGGDKIIPGQATAHSLLEAAQPEAPLARWLRSVATGGSATFIAEVCARSGLEAEQPLGMLPEDWPGLVAEAMRGIVREASAEGPGYVYRSAEELFAYPVVALRSAVDLRTHAAEDMSAALQGVHQELSQGQQVGTLRQRLQSVAAAAFEKTHKIVAERELALVRAADAEKYRRFGELILANLHAIPPRAQKIAVTDYYDPDMPSIEIELNPNHPPQEVAQIYFNRYKRARRAAEKVPALLHAAQTQQEYLQDVLEQLAGVTELSDLEMLADELTRQGVLKARRGKTVRPQKPRLPGLALRGYSITWGRSGLQNDEVVREATADDIWLHVVRGPGGHVVIHTAGRPERVPEDVLEAAASHAAALCAQRGQDKVEIAYTLVKHVRKPRGAPPGFVHYTNFKTTVVPPRRLDG